MDDSRVTTARERPSRPFPAGARQWAADRCHPVGKIRRVADGQYRNAGRGELGHVAGGTPRREPVAGGEAVDAPAAERGADTGVGDLPELGRRVRRRVDREAQRPDRDARGACRCPERSRCRRAGYGHRVGRRTGWSGLADAYWSFATVSDCGRRRAAELPEDAAAPSVDRVHRVEVPDAEHDLVVTELLDRIHVDDIGILVSPVDVRGRDIDVVGHAPTPHDLVVGVQLDDHVVGYLRLRRPAPTRQVRLRCGQRRESRGSDRSQGAARRARRGSASDCQRCASVLR